MVKKMKNVNLENNSQNLDSILGRGLRALAFKQSGNTRILRNVKSLADQAQEVCAPTVCSNSGTIAL